MFEGRALASGIFLCPKCGLEGPLNVEIRESNHAPGYVPRETDVKYTRETPYFNGPVFICSRNSDAHLASLPRERIEGSRRYIGDRTFMKLATLRREMAPDQIVF